MRHLINKIPLGLLLLGVIVIFTNCKKEHLAKDGSIEQYALNSEKKVNAHIKFTAEETSYSKFNEPFSTDPAKASKFCRTVPKTQSYNMSLDVNDNNFNLIMDNMNFVSPVQHWNTSSNTIKKIVNDGVTLKMYDPNGKIVLEQSADLSEPKPASVYSSLSNLVTNQSLDEIIKDLESKEATVYSDDEAYYVKTDINNPNFEKNSVSVYLRSIGKLISYTEFADDHSGNINQSKWISYDDMGNPSSVYTETKTKLDDGDTETIISILKLRDVAFINN